MEKFDPWQPAKGSEQEAEPGIGRVSLSVLLQKKVSGTVETVYRLDFPACEVPVGGVVNTK